MLAKLKKKLNGDKTQIVTTLKNSNCDLLKNSICDKTQIVTKLKL